MTYEVRDKRETVNNMNDINGKTAVYGIIGNPIGHTLSPVIHNTISGALGINAVYVPFEADDDLDSMVRGLYSLGVRGINVTVPYKTDIITRLCGLDPMAGEIGAVNTLKYTEDGYYGYNTDILGLDRELEDEGVELDGRDVVILGAGGAARAVAFLCASKSPAVLTIVNRTLSKAQAIRDDVLRYAERKGLDKKGLSVKAVTTDDLAALKSKDLIVFQCTNVGLSPRDNECVVDEKSFFDRVSVGIDLIYRPSETLFMKRVRESGGKAYNGLKMLIYQAVCAYEIWHDVRVPYEVIDNIGEILTKADNPA